VSLTIRNSCPACEETKIKKIFSLPYNSKKMISFLETYYKGLIPIYELDGFKYQLIECKNCSLIYQEQIPDKKFSQELYENYIDKEDSLLKKSSYEQKYYKKLHYEINLIKGILKKKNKEISILDYGAGWGFWLKFFKKNNFNVCAYEVSETRINFLKKNNIQLISDITNTNTKFDFIYSEETFEHIANPKETLINLSKILKVGGFIMLRFPSSFLFKYRLNDSYKPTTDCAHPLEHINLLKRKSFEKMMIGSDLKIIDLKSKFNFSIRNFLKDIKNILYFDSILIKKTNK